MRVSVVVVVWGGGDDVARAGSRSKPIPGGPESGVKIHQVLGGVKVNVVCMRRKNGRGKGMYSLFMQRKFAIFTVDAKNVHFCPVELWMCRRVKTT
jgi:hypothetical protein